MPHSAPTKPVTDADGVAYGYVPFVGKRRNDDGTLTVFGKASGPGRDVDSQGMNPEWLRKEIQDWYDSGANVREMHQLSAVGKGQELGFDDADAFVASKVVDPLAITKCEHEVYTGYSIGIKKPVLSFSNPDYPGGEFVGGKIIELSLVDRPALPSAKLVIAKAAQQGEPLEVADASKADKLASEPHAFAPSEGDANKCATCGAAKDKGMHKKDFDGDGDTDGKAAKAASNPVVAAALEFVAKVQAADAGKVTDDERDAAGEAGQAIDLGQDHPSYPIRNVDELKKAIQAFGRSNPEDRGKLKDFIVSRAKALGKPDLIPDGWDTAGKAAGGDPAQQHSSTATAILKSLADLFVQEAQEMADGDDELPSLQALLDCYGALKWWLWTEADEGEPVTGDALPDVGFAVKPDVGKAGARHSAADQKAIQAAHDATVQAGAMCSPADDANKAATPDVAKVSAELAEAMARIQSVESTNEALRARVEEMGRIAAPSDVRRMAGQGNTQKLARADALRADIATLTMRSQGAIGPAADGYEGLIRTKRDELAALIASKE